MRAARRGTLEGGGDGGTDAGVDGGAGFDAGCGSDLDCFLGSAPRYKLSTGVCVECVQDSDCVSMVPRCDLTKDTCVGCLSNADCTQPTVPVCTPAQGCQPCNTNAACGPGLSCAFSEACDPLPDACANPQALSLPTGTGTVNFSVDPGATIDETAGSCNGAGGPELVCSFTTTAVRELTAAPLAGSQAKPVVYVRGPSCTAGLEKPGRRCIPRRLRASSAAPWHPRLPTPTQLLQTCAPGACREFPP